MNEFERKQLHGRWNRCLAAWLALDPAERPLDMRVLHERRWRIRPEGWSRGDADVWDTVTLADNYAPIVKRLLRLGRITDPYISEDEEFDHMVTSLYERDRSRFLDATQRSEHPPLHDGCFHIAHRRIVEEGPLRRVLFILDDGICRELRDLLLYLTEIPKCYKPAQI